MHHTATRRSLGVGPRTRKRKVGSGKGVWRDKAGQQGAEQRIADLPGKKIEGISGLVDGASTVFLHCSTSFLATVTIIRPTPILSKWHLRKA